MIFPEPIILLYLSVLIPGRGAFVTALLLTTTLTKRTKIYEQDSIVFRTNLDTEVFTDS